MTTTVRLGGRSFPSVHMIPVLSSIDPSLSMETIRRCGSETANPRAVDDTDPKMPVKNVLFAGLRFHQSSQVCPMEVVTRSFGVITCDIALIASNLFIGRHLDTFPGEDHCDRP